MLLLQYDFTATTVESSIGFMNLISKDYSSAVYLRSETSMEVFREKKER